jgi:hyperpolarization activated cyclic nucleotide-gated potassium channel 2
MVFIIYEIMSIPFRISFDVTFSEEFDTFVNAIFFMDIFISFNTGCYINGELTYSRKDIALGYLKMWFWLDLAASFPYE